MSRILVVASSLILFSAFLASAVIVTEASPVIASSSVSTTISGPNR